MNKPAKKAPKKADPDQVAQFENSLNELEELVTRMEGGDQTLDESLQSFERGITLFRNCQGALEQAELRVSLLLDPDNPESAKDFPDLTKEAADPKTSGSDTNDGELPF